MISEKYIAHICGISLILMAILAGFSYGYVFESLIGMKSILSVSNNINAYISIFRIAIWGFVVVLALDVIVSFGLYRYFKKINQKLARNSSVLRLIYCVFLAIAISMSFFALLGAEEVRNNPSAITYPYEYMTKFYSIFALGLLVFSIHIGLLGMLVLKSNYMPFIIGVILILAAIGYFLTSFVDLTSLKNSKLDEWLNNIFLLPMIFGELSLAIFLLIGKKTNN